MVRKRIPRFSWSLYQTTSWAIKLPVRTAFTTINGMRMTKKVE
jgi:hypothetical protein